MKITLIHKNPNSSYAEPFIKQAKKMGITFQIKHITSYHDFLENLDKLGDMVMYGPSFFNTTERFVSLKIPKIAHLNSARLYHPYIGNKYYQQLLFQENNVSGILSYKADTLQDLKTLISDKKLAFPFIAKPLLGSRGENILLIEKKGDLKNIKDSESMVYQNFIENDGDYRVTIVGGRVLGIMKRVAKAGEYRNNLSKGGSASALEYGPEFEKISEIALKVSALCNLSFCGVDIVFDKNEKIYKCIEVNTLPMIQRFSEYTGINAAEHVLTYCKEFVERDKKKLVSVVRNTYENHNVNHKPTEFHYNSRMFLWTKNKKFKKNLNSLKTYYGLENDASIEEKVKEILKRKIYKQVAFKEIRNNVVKKHPRLPAYTGVLFFAIFAKTIYNINISHIVEKYISVEDFKDFASKLLNDKKSLERISTMGINGIYLSHFYINVLKKEKYSFDENKLLEIAENFSKDIPLSLQIYFLTHVIIGKSYFYSKKVTNKALYKKFLLMAEKLIHDNFTNVSLDHKFEFLVCCRILGYTSSLQPMITVEAEKSLCQFGNFLVDTHNTYKNDIKNNIIKVEHRNVLYVMSCSDPNWE